MRQVAETSPIFSVRITLFTLLALASGCHSHRSYYTPPSINGLRFSAGVRLAGAAGDTLAVSVRAVNTSTKDVLVECGHCSRLNTVVVLASFGGRAIVSPGQVLTHDLRVRLSEILGDSLGAGRYRITAGIDINGRHVRNLKAGDVEIPLLTDTLFTWSQRCMQSSRQPC